MKISRAKSLNNHQHPPRTQELLISEFVDLFRPEAYKICVQKSRIPVWSPATFQGSREAEACDKIYAYVTDMDETSSEFLRSLEEKFTNENRHFIVHSTFGYKPPQEAKCRFIFPFTTPVHIDSPYRWSDALWPRLTEVLGFKTKVDYSCRDVSRAYFLPANPTEDSPVHFYHHAGVDLDPQALLGDLLSLPYSKFDFSEPYESEENINCPVDLGSIELRLRTKYRKRNSEYCRAIEAVLDSEETKTGERHQTLRLFTHALARVALPEEPSEKLIEIMYPWLEGLGSRGSIAEALRALQGAREKIPSWDARTAFELAEFDKHE